MLIFQKLSRRPYNSLEMNINGFWVIYDIFLSIFVNLTAIEVTKRPLLIPPTFFTLITYIPMQIECIKEGFLCLSDPQKFMKMYQK